MLTQPFKVRHYKTSFLVRAEKQESRVRAVFILVLLVVVAGPTHAQIATYSLHRENSTIVSTNMKLLTAGPDASALTLQTVELRNQPAGEYAIKSFETQANVPNIAGVIPAASSFLLRLYMNKTADAGTMSPLSKIYKNNTSGTSILQCEWFWSHHLTSSSYLSLFHDFRRHVYRAIDYAQVVSVDCDPVKRNERLHGERGQNLLIRKWIVGQRICEARQMR